MVMLEHLNLVVADIQKSLDFYRAAFPFWKIRTQGHMEWYGVERHWVHFGDDYNYLSLNDRGTGENRDLTSNSIGLAHFAFTTNQLSALVQRLQDAGYRMQGDIRTSTYRRNAYFIDPDGYEVEFVEYLSDLPAERNSDD